MNEAMAEKDNWGPPGPDEFEGDGAVATEAEKKLKRPKRYRVLLHNDNFTTMEFVVMVLMSIFNHSQAKAMRTMLQVHQDGVGVAGIYSHEVAETKMAKVEALARQYEFPLRCTMEPE